MKHIFRLKCPHQVPTWIVSIGYYYKTSFRFDGSGFRTNFTLEIVELKKDGLEKVRLNPTKLIIHHVECYLFWLQLKAVFLNFVYCIRRALSIIHHQTCWCIHSKSWFRWFPETAESFELSAERLSENAKTVNCSMCVRKITKIITNIITNYYQLSFSLCRCVLFSCLNVCGYMHWWGLTIDITSMNVIIIR